MSYNSRYSGQGGNRRASKRDDRDHRDDRDGRDGRDSSSFLPARPQSPPYRNGTTSLPPRPPVSAANRDNRDRDNGDNYRPSSYSDRNDSGGRDPGTSSSHDNYRPPQGDFTFRIDKPAGVQDHQFNDSHDSHRPQDGRRPSRRGQASHGNRGGPHGRQSESRWQPRGGRAGGRSGGRPPWRPFVASERELLSSSHGTEPAHAVYTDNGVTYRALDDLSDSEEAEMDISGDEAGGSPEPSHKRARHGLSQSAAGDSVPKWSNPDPYTALPPPEAAQAKKKDVVQLIRKARVQSKDTKALIPADTADFISCDFDESDDNDGEEEPKPAEKELRPIDRAAERYMRAAAPPPPSSGLCGTAPPSIPAPPPPNGKPPRARPATFQDPTPSVLGSRKRTYEDEIKLPHTKIKKVSPGKLNKASPGSIVEDWQPIESENPCPWLRADHSNTPLMGVWLHKEIVDFFDYIKPREFEERIRNEVVKDLKQFCRNTFRDAEVYPFGSFPSGLYLPTGDMDMAFLSDSYLHGGRAKYNSKNTLWKLRDALQRHNMAWEGEIDVIHKARVPLVKFNERETGLKVDISFENTTGIQAISTFKAWKQQYPAMPALVTLIKHLLCMRGLNEPVNGGIGGFSVICLVVSMMQTMPQVQSRTMNTEHHLGDLLMQFLDLYGNKFNYQTTAISLSPPKYIPKNKVNSFAYKNYNRLSIIDPNNPENDIAGGSSNITTIVEVFSEAHSLLGKRMAELAQSPNRQNASILEVVFAGNYSSFRYQRAHLNKLADSGYAAQITRTRAPPPPTRW
ncbi:hypothetical protein B0T17DRAFT_588797 [Bombardia bombarda]|uniref:polynucleotide adenylyltransferase n=1 Tax=Bombardia bombarda TaxID=252184 RepID=A0AA39X7J5_9PEZI|nr:hypothetical protein B0T17DRAFT_588797 [Bombardia bombarda]